ncbi:resolvase [Clostridium sporogenes]|uniref:recombinase family protein n=1 Tax=Clostridium sporogenes TaxID=1509 RepID=UPI0007800D67|nr:recombinase family protein [Clostridium sporogenes]KYN75804.1 resolvase [Clostridium sporogenes]
MIKVVIYARVSTAEQAEEGYSIDAQLDNVRKKCEQEGRIVVNEYIDRGISGKSIKNRLALQQLVKDAKNNKFHEVWVWKTNRLARNHLDLLKIVDELDKNNIGFKSCSEAFDTSTPTGKLLMSVLSSIGEFERETIVENVKMGMKQRARTGKWNGGIVLGYKTVKVSDNDEKTKLEIAKEEATIVKKIFMLYAEGKGLKAIANLINKQGYRTKKGNLFSICSIKQILLNPIYIGKIRYNVMENWNVKRRKGINKNFILVDGEHEKIISNQLWHKVQELYKQKSNKPKRTFDGSYPLTGILKCPVCGAAMVAGRVKRKRKDGTYNITKYYQCGAWRNKGISACSSNGIRADLVETYVFNRLQEVLSNNNILNDIVNNANNKRKSKIKPLEDEFNTINKLLLELEIKKNKIFELYEEGIIDKDTLSTRLLNISETIDVKIKNKKIIEKELELNSSEPISFNKVKALMNNFNKLIQKSDNSKRKTLLQLVITEITIRNRKNIDSITMHFNEKIEKYFINNKGEGSSNEEPSPFNFTIKI